MKNYLIEVCCGSTEDGLRAAMGGAHRIELCSNMAQGGLTPTLGSFNMVRKNSDILINVMIRPREGGFFYTEAEYKTALEDAEIFTKAGADGLVAGFLNEDGTIDEKRTRDFVKIAGKTPVTCHRAFDVTPDWKKAMDTLIECGVTRILTSGQRKKVYLGLDEVKEMIEYSKGRIIIMPGAGVTPENARDILKYTGAKEIHVHFTKKLKDISASGNKEIYFGTSKEETDYPVIDEDKIRSLFD